MKKNKTKEVCLMCGQVIKKSSRVSIPAEMTATAIMLQREAENKSRMDYLMAKALLTGKLESRVISWAEQVVYVYEKMMER